MISHSIGFDFFTTLFLNIIFRLRSKNFLSTAQLVGIEIEFRSLDISFKLTHSLALDEIQTVSDLYWKLWFSSSIYA